MSEYSIGKTDAAKSELLDLIATKVSKEELMWTGFNGQYGINFPMPPVILWAHGDGRTINVAWKSSIMLTNPDHYLIQVSNDESTWGELVFDGSDFVGREGSLTEVWGNSIAHTRIPFVDGAVTKLYYRVATITKNGEQSEWSDSVSGNTFFIEACDQRPGAFWNDFSWIGDGRIEISVNDRPVWFRYQGPNTYMGSGSISTSGSAATVGSQIVFNAANTIDIDTDNFDSTKFIIAYRDFGGSGEGAAKVGTFSGVDLTYGSEYLFDSGSVAADLSLTTLDSTKFVISYRDIGNSDYGTAIIGTMSGSTISWGSEYVFNSANTAGTQIEKLDSTKFVIIYSDSGNSSYGTAIIGTMSGSTISWGSEYVFNSSTITGGHLFVTMLDSNHFVITYVDGGDSQKGKAIVGTVSGSTIFWGSEYVFNNAATSVPKVKALDSTHFVIVYGDSGNSGIETTIIGVVSGSTISFGSEYTVNGSILYSSSILKIDSTHFMLTYANSSDSNNATYINGTLSSGNVISFDSEVQLLDYDVFRFSTLLIDSNNVIISYRDDSNSSYGTSQIEDIS